MTIPSVICSAKLNQALIRDDSGLCVVLEKPLPLFRGTAKSSPDVSPLSLPSEHGRERRNSIVTEGRAIVRGRIFCILHADRGPFLPVEYLLLFLPYLHSPLLHTNSIAHYKEEEKKAPPELKC